MVWLISFLTVSNIALGYGLAVYFNRQFGTAIPSCGSLKFKKSASPTSSALASEETETISAPATQAMDRGDAAKDSKLPPKTIATPSAPATAAETNGLPPVDEENVLAGIEEFRSQLAKMNVAVEESDQAAPATTEELAAAN